ncbi:MAG: PDZ domain-containing protein, partial [Planctomycetota bacterium]
MTSRLALVASFLFLTASSPMAFSAHTVKLASSPAVSPDGKNVAFSWRDDIWIVPVGGGQAQPLTTHEAVDRQPIFSPDGGRIAFISNREGSNQVYTMPSSGGQAKQLTFHTQGYSLQQWYPDGESILTSGSRDHFWRHAERFFTIRTKPRTGESLLFDARGHDAAISPDGKSILFVREGTRWWRKGYRGSQAGQIWLYTISQKKFRKIAEHPTGCRYPMWDPSGDQFYYVSGKGGAFNLWRRKLDAEPEKARQLTEFPNDSAVFPAIARNGSVIVFRHLFDLYSFRPGKDKTPRKIKITYSGDEHRKPTLHRTLKTATDVAYSHDGLEVAFIAGGDVWVMDTELREPKQITDTAEEERGLAFSPENDVLLFVSDKGQQSDIWSATRDNPGQYWWQNDTFSLQKLTDDSDLEKSISWSPTGEQIAFVKSPGDLWVMKPDGTEAQRVIESWNAPDYDWSPDGKWFVYSVNDNNFNREVFIVPLDGSREPFNLSMHPRDDRSPVWSPDGARIAFTGTRIADEDDVYYVFLREAKEDESSRDRKLKKALEKMEKGRKQSKPDAAKEKSKPRERRQQEDEEKEQPDQENEDEKGSERKEDEKPSVEPVVIDFDGLRDRIHRIAVPNSQESHLFWSHDSKKLAFVATVQGKRGTYTVEFPSNLKPKLLTRKTGTHAQWIKPGNQILWLSGGMPTSFSASNGRATPYPFSAQQATDVATRYETAFMQCWRYMRENFYDPRLNNRNWDAIYRKYVSMARQAIDPAALADVVSLMLGELNASHLGFRPRSSDSSPSDDWRDTTAHLGLRFEPGYNGPGLKVRDVILNGAADKAGSRITAGEVVLSVDGQDVDPAMDLTKVLNGPLERDVTLRVKNCEGQERDVAIRPMSYEQARESLYEMWIRHNRDSVDEASNGRLGYLHIRAMNMGSFYRFEQELYKIGCGKDGLIIDVRENGGGSTTDHLLTALTQPD